MQSNTAPLVTTPSDTPVEVNQHFPFFPYFRKQHDSVSRRRERKFIFNTVIRDKYPTFPLPFLTHSTVQNVSLLFLFFLPLISPFRFISACFVFFSLIIFSHFLHPVGAVKWPIVEEQTVCVWDISCWFSGTLAWWMARQKTPNNSWFASRETALWACSLRTNNVQHPHHSCSPSNDDSRGFTCHYSVEDETWIFQNWWIRLHRGKYDCIYSPELTLSQALVVK